MSTNVEESTAQITFMHPSISPGLFKWPKEDVAETELKFVLSTIEAPTPVSGGRSYSLPEYMDVQAKFITFSKRFFGM